ncbi:hypothetical protein V9T40_014786 [Parthenolecanium corni]|uniref:Uncharacterized protein n=1 Tax=Parthenolecanium corni TaxID=536013 RepID=A0AAN9T441_9HEMI
MAAAASAAAAAQPLMLVRVNVIRKLQSAGEMGRDNAINDDLISLHRPRYPSKKPAGSNTLFAKQRHSDGFPWLLRRQCHILSAPMTNTHNHHTVVCISFTDHLCQRILA